MTPTLFDDSQDVVDSFDRGACSYMVKLADYTKLADMLSTIDGYWSSSEWPVSG